MSFEAFLGFQGNTGTIYLAGSVDADSIPAFRALMEQATGRTVERLVLDMTGVERLSTAAVRLLAFTHQRMRPGTPIIVVGAPEEARETIRQAGFAEAVVLAETSR